MKYKPEHPPMIPTRKGEFCDHCGQFVKLYPRKLNSGMAATLYWMVNESGIPVGQWLHPPTTAPRFVLRAKDFCLLAHWGLIGAKPTDPDSKLRTSGYWKVRAKGAAFARGEIELLSHILTFDNRMMGFTGDWVTFQDCLGENFSYPELMST